jgi:hypothetical protein
MTEAEVVAILGKPSVMQAKGSEVGNGVKLPYTALRWYDGFNNLTAKFSRDGKLVWLNGKVDGKSVEVGEFSPGR